MPGGATFVRGAAAATLIALSPPVEAKDVKGLWSLGGNIAFQTTLDSVGSNADLTGDPRPDDLVQRETAVEDALSYGFNAGFGITSWLSLQLDAGYFAGAIGPIDGYLEDRFPVATNPANPVSLNGTRKRQVVVPVPAGTITQIPVNLSGILRFRRDRMINPFVGAGLGMIFTEVGDQAHVAALNERLGELRIRSVVDETGRDLTPSRFSGLKARGDVPFTFPLEVRSKDAFSMHVMLGLEYFFRDRVALVAAARYTFSGSSVSLGLGGEDEVILSAFSEKLFRPDRSLRIFRSDGQAPNPLSDPANPSSGVRCDVNTTGDFDGDGHRDDLCYLNDSGTVQDDPDSRFVLQGGEIDLSGYNLQIGLRFLF